MYAGFTRKPGLKFLAHFLGNNALIRCVRAAGQPRIWIKLENQEIVPEGELPCSKAFDNHRDSLPAANAGGCKSVPTRSAM